MVRQILAKRVGRFFLRDCRRRAVSGQNARIVGQGAQFRQRLAQRVRVAAGQIGSSRRTRKQNIAADTHVFARKIKRDRAGRMAWQQHDFALKIADVQSLSVAQPNVGNDNVNVGQTHQHGGGIGQTFEQPFVVAVHRKIDIKPRFPQRVVVDVIEVPVRVPNRAQCIVFALQFEYSIESVAALKRRVDDDDLSRCVIAQKVKIVGHRADFKGFDMKYRLQV